MPILCYQANRWLRFLKSRRSKVEARRCDCPRPCNLHICLLPFALCLLPFFLPAVRLLPAAYCLLPTAYCCSAAASAAESPPTRRRCHRDRPRLPTADCRLLTAHFFLPGEAFRPHFQQQLQLAVDLPVRDFHLPEQDQGVTATGHQARLPLLHRLFLMFGEVASLGQGVGTQLLFQEVRQRLVVLRLSPLPCLEWGKLMFGVPVALAGAIERHPQFLLVAGELAPLGSVEQVLQDAEDHFELSRRVLEPHQPTLLHFRAGGQHSQALAQLLALQVVPLGPLEFAQLDGGVQAVELAALPEVVGEAIEEDVLQGRAGRIGGVKVLAQSLARRRVLVEFPHQLKAALGGIVAVLEAVLAGNALAHRGRRPGGLGGVGAIGGALPFGDATVTRATVSRAAISGVGRLALVQAAGAGNVWFRVDQTCSVHFLPPSIANGERRVLNGERRRDSVFRFTIHNSLFTIQYCAAESASQRCGMFITSYTFYTSWTF